MEPLSWLLFSALPIIISIYKKYKLTRLPIELGMEPFSWLLFSPLQMSISNLQIRKMHQITYWAGNGTNQLVVSEFPANEYFNFTNSLIQLDCQPCLEWNHSTGCYSVS